MNRPSALLIGALAAMALRCSVIPLAGGDVTETGNARMLGTVVDENGHAAPHTRVYAVPDTFDPVRDGPLSLLPADTTDGNGAYVFSGLGRGVYSVEAVQIDNRTRAIVRDVSLANDTVKAPVAMLRVAGAIKVILPDSGNFADGYVYIPGTTTSLIFGDIGSSVVLDSVPAGTVPSIKYGTRGSSKQRIIRYDVTVTSGDTAVVALSFWKYAKRMSLNTTASGAGITGKVTQFPVLVRLTGANFDFSRAGVNGSDLRFANSGGTPLAYEIGRWDAGAQRAEIWVRVDTVRGNDSTPRIVMYYGNPAAQAMSSGPAVFDTSTGALGVWHLDEAATAVPGGYRDASASGLHLTGAGATPSVEGVVGRARSFDSTADYLSGDLSSKLNGNASFTVLFWVHTGTLKKDNIIENRVDMLDFGDKPALRNVFHFLLWPNYTAQFGFQDTSFGSFCPDTNRVGAAQNIFDFSGLAGTWTFIATVYDASTTMLSTWINGKLRDRDAMSDINLVSSGGIRMGRAYYDGDMDFTGSLDEVRIFGRPLAPEEIKLNYEAQRMYSILVKIE